jgi:hypothetical protein
MFDACEIPVARYPRTAPPTNVLQAQYSWSRAQEFDKRRIRMPTIIAAPKLVVVAGPPAREFGNGADNEAALAIKEAEAVG